MLFVSLNLNPNGIGNLHSLACFNGPDMSANLFIVKD